MNKNPEDQLWGIAETRWFERQVEALGLDAARELVQEAIDKRDALKQKKNTLGFITDFRGRRKNERVSLVD